MDKYEYKVRADEIKDLISRGEYAQAAEIADTIDWRRVKSVMMLCTISDLYKINRRYEDARDMLLLAYERRPGGRTICYSLCELSIKTEEYVEAVEYYKEFVQVAPKDSGRYILQYKLYEAQDVSLEERIAVLEELKKRDYREKWAYELAYLYHRIGLAARCVEECDELILWFGEGKYVIKALELKMLHEPLTEEQQRRYDRRLSHGGMQVSEEAGGEIASVEKSSEIQDEQTVAESRAQEMIISEESPSVGDTQVYEPVGVAEEDEVEILVKTMDVGQYNTINLQAELAEGLREVLDQEKKDSMIPDPVTRSLVAPLLDSDTESLDYPEIDEVSEDDLEPSVEQMESTEVFFGETEEIGDIREAVEVEEAETEAAEVEAVQDVTAELVMEQLRQEAEPPKELARVLSQGPDGQLSLVMPEEESIEKQITGQMSIDDILLEWEKVKKEQQEKQEQTVRQHVLEHTGNLFTEFEVSVRDGLLEQLEREKLDVEAETEAFAEESVEHAEAAENEELAAYGEIEELAEYGETEEIEELAEYEEAEETEELVAYEEAEETEELAEYEEAEETEELVEYEEAEGTEELAEYEEAEEIEAPVEYVESEELEESVENAESEETEESAEQAESEAGAEPEDKEVGDVVREEPKVRTLTREEKEIFGPYIQSKSSKEQLIKALDNISLAAYTGNVIITGDEGSDTITLAKNMIREVQITDRNFSGKVAKISGSALNHKDVDEVLGKLKGGALIIAKASEVNKETAEALHKLLQQESLGIVVLMEDTKKAMDRFLGENGELCASFTSRMDIDAMSNDMLVAWGRRYAREQEYSIDDFGMLALHTRIEELQTIDHAVTVVEVREIVDEAIKRANRKTLRHFFDVLFARRYDEEDMIILGERDFV